MPKWIMTRSAPRNNGELDQESLTRLFKRDRSIRLLKKNMAFDGNTRFGKRSMVRLLRSDPEEAEIGKRGGILFPFLAKVLA